MNFFPAARLAALICVSLGVPAHATAQAAVTADPGRDGQHDFDFEIGVWKTQFKNGRGGFFDQESFNGRTILVRNVWSDITADSCRFEQAFSEDGGKSWEMNWIAVDTRVK